jgi:hypothetical protein
VDPDTTLGDGGFALAEGKARCKRGELVIGGGVRRIASDGLFPGPPRWFLEQAGPLARTRQFLASAWSDLGGLGRKNYLVIAVCMARS